MTGSWRKEAGGFIIRRVVEAGHFIGRQTRTLRIIKVTHYKGFEVVQKNALERMDLS
jgi:hypothetical protein